MTITIEASVLAKAMKNAARIVQSAQTLPILANVRLTAHGETLEIVTSDLDTEFRQTLPLAEPGELAVTVDARKLAQLATAVEGGAQMKLEIADHRLAVRAGRARWVLPVMPAEDFPLMPAGDLGAGVTVPGKTLVEAIKRTAWAASTEQTKWNMVGLNLSDEGGRVRIVGYDGNVVASVTIDAPWPDWGADEVPSIIVPSRAVATIEQLAADADAVALAWDDRKIRVEIGAIVVTAKLIDGKYPDFRGGIAALRAAFEDRHRVVAETGVLRAALRRVELVAATDKTRCIRFTRLDDRIDLSAVSTLGGMANEEVSAEVCAEPGEGLVNGFDARYLAQMLDAIGGDTIEINQVDASSPALIERAVPDDFLGILCPMSL